MNMYDSIFVPTDGSTTAVAAAEGAVSLARRFDATVHAVHVVNLRNVRPTDEQLVADLRRFGENIAEEVAELATEAGVEATTSVLETRGRVHRTIIEAATERETDCIVMGTHGRTGLARVALGSVAERTLRESPVPVVTVSEDAQFAPEFERVLVPTDGSDGARAAGEHAVELAAASGASLDAVYVLDANAVGYELASTTIRDALEERGQRSVEQVLELAADADLQVETAVLHGTIARSIVDYADEHDADCIVMGTHGRTGAERVLLGSVAERVVRLAGVPVVGVKAPEMVERAKEE